MEQKPYDGGGPAWLCPRQPLHQPHIPKQVMILSPRLGWPPWAKTGQGTVTSNPVPQGETVQRSYKEAPAREAVDRVGGVC